MQPSSALESHDTLYNDIDDNLTGAMLIPGAGNTNYGNTKNGKNTDLNDIQKAISIETLKTRLSNQTSLIFKKAGITDMDGYSDSENSNSSEVGLTFNNNRNKNNSNTTKSSALLKLANLANISNRNNSNNQYIKPLQFNTIQKPIDKNDSHSSSSLEESSSSSGCECSDSNCSCNGKNSSTSSKSRTRNKRKRNSDLNSKISNSSISSESIIVDEQIDANINKKRKLDDNNNNAPVDIIGDGNNIAEDDICAACYYSDYDTVGTYAKEWGSIMKYFKDEYGNKKDEILCYEIALAYKVYIYNPARKHGIKMPAMPTSKWFNHLRNHILDPHIWIGTTIGELRVVERKIANNIIIEDGVGSEAIDGVALRHWMEVIRTIQNLYSLKPKTMVFSSGNKTQFNIDNKGQFINTNMRFTNTG